MQDSAQEKVPRHYVATHLGLDGSRASAAIKESNGPGNANDQVFRRLVGTDSGQGTTLTSEASHDQVFRRLARTDSYPGITRTSEANPGQILRRPVRTHSTHNSTWNSEASHDPVFRRLARTGSDQGTIRTSNTSHDQVLRRLVRTDSSLNSARSSQISHDVASRDLSATSTSSAATQIHHPVPTRMQASSLSLEQEHDQSRYADLDREYEEWLDEENPESLRYDGPEIDDDERPFRPYANMDPVVAGMLQRMEEVDTTHEYQSLVRRRAAANNPTVLPQAASPQTGIARAAISQTGIAQAVIPQATFAQAAASYTIESPDTDPSMEYLGYTIFGQHPGEISRDPSPIPPPRRAGRRLFESGRSTPAVLRNASFESSRSSPGPQSSVKYNRNNPNNGPS